MVILSGNLKNRRIPYHGNIKLVVRPTLSLVRKSLFSILDSHICGAVCLDLFCGTGSLGFEAVSRGASFVYFVDNNTLVLRGVRRFITVNALDNVLVLPFSYAFFVSSCFITFDYIFIDAPYSSFFCVFDILAACYMLLNLHGVLYFENFKSLKANYFDTLGFNLYRFGVKGRVYFYLLERK
ncbi:RsmD family RNA methyltransferase [Candidatus Vidania fulgoroideae]|uniref:RsmD family RNA methyltransferase n=1 Tax=Candidatus Vidania fulgoroideorum TaxID=881286 RepID=A0A974XA69_9PROT|nr:RsmD family RNA methyltransferase [Candidatus Vidania fulgoroideae]